MSQLDLDRLIDQAVTDAQTIFCENRGLPDSARSLPARITKPPRPKPWTSEEDEFYRKNAGMMSYEEMAEALGRSRNAIKVRFTRKGMPPASKAPGWMTAQKVANLLSIDPHTTVGWIRKGVLPGEVMFFTRRPIYRIAIITLKRWLVHPEHWIYFDANKIKNPAWRSLVLRAQDRWGDEWWSSRQAADYLGVDVKDITRQISIGKIRGIQAKNRGGRDRATWSLWYVRKSDAVNLVIPRGKGGDKLNYPWPAGADRFLVHARDGLKLEWEAIGRMMKWSQKRCAYRYKLIKQEKVP